VVRLLVPEEREFLFEDEIRGQVSMDSREVDDQVLIKSDGYPTYHLANVVDDHLMEISHVIRGVEWLVSVPKHLLLYEYLDWQPPVMAHLPLINNPDGSKMSKRHVDRSGEFKPGKVDPDVATYIRMGYEKEALLNYIALLGWNPGEGDEREVFTLDQLVEEFSLKRVNRSPAVFDLNKLNWMNGEHIARRESDKLAIQAKPELEKCGFVVSSNEYLIRVIDLMKSRIRFVHEIATYSSYFFKDPEKFDPKGIKKRWHANAASYVLEYADDLERHKEFNGPIAEESLRRIADKHHVSAGKIIHPVRLAVTGITSGPSLFEILEVLGKETVLRRLRKAVEVIGTKKS
jgi:glutamyl-tRNA synthetase